MIEMLDMFFWGPPVAWTFFMELWGLKNAIFDFKKDFFNRKILQFLVMKTLIPFQN